MQEEKKSEVKSVGENGVITKDREQKPVKPIAEKEPPALEAPLPEDERKSTLTEAEERFDEVKAVEEVKPVAEEKLDKKQPVKAPEEEDKKPSAVEAATTTTPPEQGRVKEPTKAAGADQEKQKAEQKINNEGREVTRDVVTDALHSLATSIISLLKR